MPARVKRDTKKYEPGYVRKASAIAIKRARATNCLKPHELLYYWANGVCIGGLTPDPDMQLAAAIAAAPYYAPKLANIEVKSEHHVKAVIGAVPLTAEEWASKYLPGQSSALPVPELVNQNTNSGEVIAEPTPTPSPWPGRYANGGILNQSKPIAENSEPPADEKKTESETV